jgi:hypothetical protein
VPVEQCDPLLNGIALSVLAHPVLSLKSSAPFHRTAATFDRQVGQVVTISFFSRFRYRLLPAERFISNIEINKETGWELGGSLGGWI